MIFESIEKIAQESKICVQLYSGGLDSNTFAFLAKQLGIEFVALHIDLGPEPNCNKPTEAIRKLNINYTRDLKSKILDSAILKNFYQTTLSHCYLSGFFYKNWHI